MAESHWSLDPRGDPSTVCGLLDCVVELGTVAQGLSQKRALVGGDGWRILRAIVRQMSVPLRKLCLDRDGALLKGVVSNPTFHPLGGSRGTYRGAELSWRTDRREWTLGYADGTRETVVVPETEHVIELGRLYGVDFLKEVPWCHVHEPFDVSAPRIAMDDWLSLKAAQVNSVGYTVRDALRIVADYEGAHTNDLYPVVSVGTDPESIDRGRNMKYRLINCVRFGCLSYAQILVMYAGLYVIREMQHLLARVEQTGRLAELQASAVARVVGQVRTELRGRAKITNGTHELILVGVSNVPGKRGRQPVYRLWSGSRHWDAPTPNALEPAVVAGTCD